MEKRSCYCETHSLPFPFIFCHAIAVMFVAVLSWLWSLLSSRRSCFCHPDRAQRAEGSVSVYLKNSKMYCSGLGKFINFTQSIKTS